MAFLKRGGFNRQLDIQEEIHARRKFNYDMINQVFNSELDSIADNVESEFSKKNRDTVGPGYEISSILSDRINHIGKSRDT